MPRLPAPLRPMFPYLQPKYLQLNRVVAPATIRLSRLRGGQVPSGVALSLEEAAASTDGRCVTVREAEVIARPPLTGWPRELAGEPVEPCTDTEIARIAVAELPGGRVLGPSRALITGRGDLVWELSHYFGASHPRHHPVFTQPFPGAPSEVPGRLGVLASRGDSNYYHFMVDVLPRLGVLEQAPEIAEPDRWYVAASTPFQRQLLDMCGITQDRRIDADRFPHVRADCLVVPGVPSVVGEKNPPWVVEFLRHRLMADVVLPPAALRRPLYVLRRAGAHNRAVVNEDAVIRLLQARGFDVIDPSGMTVRQQIQAFASASVIVSPHGAALTNLVFASPGSVVIELFPAGCILPCYWRLAHSAGVEYRFLSTRLTKGPARRTAQSTQSALVMDIAVDLDGLCQALAEVQVA